MSKKVMLGSIQAQTGADRTYFVTWTFTTPTVKNKRRPADHYDVQWDYATGDGVWFSGSDSSTSDSNITYSAPQNATKIRVRVKPVSKTYQKKSGNKTVTKSYWTGAWSAYTNYNIVPDSTPARPSAPTVTIDQFTLTVTLDTYDENTTSVRFEVVKDNTQIFAAGTASVVTNHASWSCNIMAGGVYKVHCYGIGSGGTGEWSEYSGNVGTIPATPSKITRYDVLALTEVHLYWNAVANAEHYEVEWTHRKDYFDSASETQTESTADNTPNRIITGLDVADNKNTWYFRVRAVNSNGNSGWSEAISIVFGEKPAAPTTWAETTTAIVGEDVHLYWVHNSEDGSSQVAAQLELITNGTTTTITVNNSTDPDERDKTSEYSFQTALYAEGTTLLWRVRTRGVLDEYGDWSVQRTVKIYAPPTLRFGVSGTNNWYWDTFNFNTDDIYTAPGTGGELIEVLRTFPFYVSAEAGPSTQNAVGYNVSVVANETYETIDQVGRTVWISEGQELYSKFFTAYSNTLFIVLNAGDIDLENGMSYTIRCTVSMDSGLTAEASGTFSVSWDVEDFDLDAEIIIDYSNLSANIMPYCTRNVEDTNEPEQVTDEDDVETELVENVVLSVYRREYDGRFVEIAKGLDNEQSIAVTDPHPALDFARYRIVALDKTTGHISFYDVPGEPMEEKAVILQWDEDWSEYNLDPDNDEEAPTWSGSLLKLPYNIDVSDKYSPDVALVEYIGRQHPVSYYGTQLGVTATWNMEIDAEDKDTLYGLRRLAIYTGDVYVREPSGSGYWAQVGVSFQQKHLGVTIPVTLDIKRVEGGI